MIARLLLGRPNVKKHTEPNRNSSRPANITRRAVKISASTPENQAAIAAAKP
ncbi:Uncharacterised protein [Acinetobacter baumannii]|nr:Uncharacterised protein [Acinetobacter baumannii]